MNSLFGDAEVPVPVLRDTRPLAARMRPRTFADLVGQEAQLGADRPLRLAVERDNLPSLILWGPPGTGKTTLAEVIAGQTQALFVRLSAVTSGVADLRKAVDEAKRLRRTGRRTVLFIDEIHRFNRAQQDAILPHVEDGTVCLIGATTQNPSFEVNAALLSRARVVVLAPLSDEAIATIVLRALHDTERGLGKLHCDIAPEALARLVNFANGDARTALNTLEFAAFASQAQTETRRIELEDVKDALAQRPTGYDKSGEAHYDTISAYIKSMRASNPDGAIYWLARMLEGGEDPLFIARRLIVFASEDIGLADSRALALAVAAQQAVHVIGMPEGYYPLSHATLYMALAAKSRAVGDTYGAALADVQLTRNEPVPLHLRNAPTSLMRELGYAQPNLEQELLPSNIAEHRYFDRDSIVP